MLFNEVQITGERKSSNRYSHVKMRDDTYGLKYLFSHCKSLRLINIEFKGCYPDTRVNIDCSSNLTNLVIKNSLICEPILFLNHHNCKLKSVKLADSDLEILDYRVFRNVQTLKLAGNNTCIIEKIKSRTLSQLYVKQDHTQLYLTKLTPYVPKLEFLKI